MKITAFLASLVFMMSAFSYEAKITKGELPATIESMIDKVNADLNDDFSSKDFLLIEDRRLATSHFKMYVQQNSDIPVAHTAIRIWSNLKTNELILAELHLDENLKRNEEYITQKYLKAKFTPAAIKSKKLAKAINDKVTEVVQKHSTDKNILSFKYKDRWVNGDLVRQVEVRGRRGFHFINISLLRNSILNSTYSEFPQSEHFTTLKANVFPIYEEVEMTGEKLPYEVKELKYIKTAIPDGGENPLSVFENVVLSESLYDPLLAETEAGQSNGYWSEASIRRSVEDIVSKFPSKNNDFTNGLLLQGKYATINLHPDSKSYTGVNFPLRSSINHTVLWKQSPEGWQAKPLSGLYGQGINSEDEALNLIPVRLPDHDPVSYINSGFDEIQVYYAVTVLMESLSQMGFEDPELSTQPFHAFLFDPDISSKDNAYYVDNTINFTTYNHNMPNLARDNPTIWHELGHGIMDRLMGAHLSFAGSQGSYGGLSEGMADFIAKIMVEHQTDGANFPGKNDFRIMNETGFYLTNEFHDEGEAYGGAMSDMLDQVLKQQGREGLYDFTDLTLEAMRLTRNHPSLTPKAWFEHMLYADELGNEVRESGQFKETITSALIKRNFSFSESFLPASMKVTFEKGELTNTSEASREKPISVCGFDGSVSYDLAVKLNSGDGKFIKFPALVKVEFKKGSLQGAIRWEGEDRNPIVYSVNSEDEILNLQLKAYTNCETINQPDGSCKDYAYLQVFNNDSIKPIAKKRFYLKLKKEACELENQKSKK